MSNIVEQQTIIKALTQAIGEPTFVCLLTASINSRESEVGLIISANDSGYLLKRYSNCGMEDGWVAGRISDIISVSFPSGRAHVELSRSDIFDTVKPSLTDLRSIICRELSIASELEQVITICGSNHDLGILGKVLTIDTLSGFAAIQRLTFGGILDGISIVSISSITRLTRCGLFEMNVEFLAQQKGK